MKQSVKKILAVLLAALMMVSFAACASGESGEEEEKKQLPGQTAGQPEEEPKVHYKETMLPFEELIPANRIVVLQNTIAFNREGFYTEETKPQTQEIEYKGAATPAYPISYPVSFLHNGIVGDVTVYQTDGTSQTVSQEDFSGMYVVIDSFQSGNPPVLYNPATGTEIAAFSYALTGQNEAIFSIITEQDKNVREMVVESGWDDTATYRLMATDQFYVPITPEEYDDGELRGSLSGAINGSFPEMTTIASGKINDIVYIEQVVE